jgi:hypothetical protein
MTAPGAFVAAASVLLFAPAAAVSCSSSHRAAKGLEGVSGSSSALPKNRLIVLGRSIGGVSLGEPRKTVEKAFGHGKSRERGVVSYFGGRLLVIYWFHDQLTTRVDGLVTRWGGFRTRSGVRIGTSRQALSALHVTCRDEECVLAAGRLPDAPGTIFTMRRGKAPRSTSCTAEANHSAPAEQPASSRLIRLLGVSRNVDLEGGG